MTDKMREEFEAWFCSTMPYKIAKESWFAVMDDGDYIITDVQAAWAGWKASRAALCVDVITWHENRNGELFAYEDDVVSALKSAGVSYS